MFYRNFVPVFEIFDFKNAVTLKTGLGVRQRQCHHAIEGIYDFPLTFHSRLTMALSRVVAEIFNVEKYRDLEIPEKSQSRSLKVVLFDRLVYFPISFV